MGKIILKNIRMFTVTIKYIILVSNLLYNHGFIAVNERDTMCVASADNFILVRIVYVKRTLFAIYILIKKFSNNNFRLRP
jgi:hypothetical protein